uniref:Uncharacterized protein n=1 Tax=Lotus japonicus TaxID=34305 RepID=I3T923_LOTJA|nr:unknown [Lotus japonicus]
MAMGRHLPSRVVSWKVKPVRASSSVRDIFCVTTKSLPSLVNTL